MALSDAARAVLVAPPHTAMRPKKSINYLAGYPPTRVSQIRQLIAQDQLAERLLLKYPLAHETRTDRALYDYVLATKDQYLRNTGGLSRVAFDSKLHVMRNALGLHTRISRVQGSKLKTRREILIGAAHAHLARTGQQTQDPPRNPGRDCVQGNAARISAHDRGSRTRAPQGRRA